MGTLQGSLGLPFLRAKRGVLGPNSSKDTRQTEKVGKKGQKLERAGGNSGAEGPMQTAEREEKLMHPDRDEAGSRYR